MNLHFSRRILPSLLTVAALAGAAHPQQGPGGKTSANVTFRDVTAELHLAIHSSLNGEKSLDKTISAAQYSMEFARKELLPAMGGSLTEADFDNDGYADLYVVIPGESNHLFHGLKDGTFAEVTTETKTQGTSADLSAAFADYDHCGRASLFVAGLGGVTVYHNDGGGVFSDASEKTGLKGKAGELATTVVLFDADGDGFLDALVTVYADLSAAPEKSTFLFPKDFSGSSSRLYRNQHDGTFRDVTESSGLTENPGRTRGAIAAEFTKKGRMDLLLLRDNKPPALYRNLGDFKFEETTWESGAENWKYAYLHGESADFNADGKPDLALWSTIGNEVLINRGDGKFEGEESLPMIFAPNRLFGFHGIEASVFGEGTNDLLSVDNRGTLHVIANHRGHFQQAHVSFDKNNAESMAGLSALAAFRRHKSGPLLLVGVKMNGRMIAFESAASFKSNVRAGSGKAK